MTLTTNFDPSQLFVGQTGLVLTAGLDASMPSSIDDFPTSLDDAGLAAANLDSGFVSLGLTTEDGPVPTFDRTTKDILVWQARGAARTLVTDTPIKVEFALRQWNSETFKLGVGGATIDTAGSGVVVAPEDESFIDERRLIVLGFDGEKRYAFCFRRAQNTRALTFPFKRDEDASLPIGMNVLTAPAGETGRWLFFTDDPAFEPDGS